MNTLHKSSSRLFSICKSPANASVDLWQCCQRHLLFAGAFIIRRLVGIAHTADMDSIADADVRAACEMRALRFGRHLLVKGPASYKDVQALTAAVTAARQAAGLSADTVVF